MLERWIWVINMMNLTIRQLEEKYPFVIGYFEENKLDVEAHKDKTFQEYLDTLSEDYVEEWAINKEKLIQDLKYTLSR